VARNRWTVELLAVEPEHRVLELGFGPGVGIAALAERAHRGLVVGVDHSEAMLRQARCRNRAAIRAGRVRLESGSYECLPPFEAPFDRIMAVNSLLFSEDPGAVVRELRERLRPGGLLAVTFQSRARRASDADSLRGGEKLAALFREAGLRDVRLETLALCPNAAVCVLGSR
jgi:ubiquinone/menaquinone biosynthesis C-methylase UbiE